MFREDDKFQSDAFDISNTIEHIVRFTSAGIHACETK